jgi:hypothetical protein
MFRTILTMASVILVLMLSVTGHAWAQASTGTISGTVSDQTGAVLPGVTITAVNSGTNLTREVFTNENGQYTLPLLPVGVYELRSEFPGFRSEIRAGVSVQTGQRATIAFSLEVGSITEAITVTEDAPLVQSETSSVGTIIDNKKIVDLPLNGRAFQSLTLLAPGAMEPAEGSGLGFRGGITVAGAREESTTFQLDGVAIVNGLVGMTTFKPSIDSVQEFKVQTSTYSAELGQMAGGQISVTTKSGSNEVHGVVYNFIRNSVFDARNFFDPKDENIPAFQRNNFGGNVGFPIVQNKTFLFFNGEFLRERRGITRAATVPLPAMLNGDFSGLGKQLTNPYTGEPFPNNQIPSSMFNPAGKALIDLGYAPYAPNQPGLTRNFLSSQKNLKNTEQYTFRFDHQFSDTNSFFARYSFNDDFEQDPFNQYGGITNLPDLGTRLDTQTAQSLSITDTHIFSAQTVLETRVGYNRLSQFRRGFNRTDIPTLVGINGTTDNEFNFGWPRIQMTGYDDLGTQSFPTDRSDNTYQFTVNLTHTTGSHNIKTGFQAEQFRSNRLNNSRSLGLYRFGGGYSGDAFADLLLGLPNRAQRRLGDTRNPIRHEAYGMYIQDDWKVAPTVTLNIGLRYELITPFNSTSDRYAIFNPECICIEIAGVANTRRDISRPENTDADIAALLANVNFVDTGKKKIFNGDHNNFAPRFGFAWDVFGTGRTVVKGGAGVFVDMMRLNNGIGDSNNVPFRFTQTFNFSTSTGIGLDPTSGGIGDGFLNDPFPVGLGGATLAPVGTDKNFKNAHVEQWNFGFQHELFSDLVLDFTYAGAKGNSLHRQRNINQPRPSADLSSSISDRRPIPGFANINIRESQAQSVFHALYGRVEKRFSDGITFLASYTWSKSIDNFSGRRTAGDGGTPQDHLNYDANRGVSGFDATHRLVANYVYEIPFGRGRRFLNDGPASYILGGWDVSGIMTFMTGRPLTPRMPNDNSRTGGNRTDHPNLIGNATLSSGSRTIDRWFNIDAFSAPAVGTFGNSGRNVVRGPGTNNIDFSLLKNHYFGEAGNVQFRAEIFNLPNHPNFNMPNRNFGTGNFGKIFSSRPSRQVQFSIKIYY